MEAIKKHWRPLVVSIVVLLGFVLVWRAAAAATVLPPELLRVTDSAPHRITVSWISDIRTITADQAMATSQYTARIYSKKTGKRLKTIRTSDTTVTFTDLNDNKPFRIKVWAQRDGITSEPAAIIARTSPVKPRLLTATTVIKKIYYDVLTNEPINQFGDSSSSKYIAKLSWKKARGTVRYYTVNVYKRYGTIPIKTKMTKNTVTGISGLKLNRIYKYTVTAHFNDNYPSRTTRKRKFKITKS